ncbi:histidinol dehydrogenase [Chloroflexota bacterium]
MKVIEGFESAKPMLSRQALTELYPVSSELRRRLKELFVVDDPEMVVRQIIEEVRNRGDATLLDYALKIDGIKLTSLEVTRNEISNAYTKIDNELLPSLKLAAERIRSFHQTQKDSILGRVVKNISVQIRPLERIGIYAPGGNANYPSTVLMTAIPARVAGVKEIILVTPPRKNGAVSPPTLVAADIAKVDRIFAVGGAQAIAALALGTASIPRVDKIYGPGNIFVTLAKKLVYGLVGIDGLQGPSEILIIADETTDPEYCAADLLAQAEHDSLASAILITTSPSLARKVMHQLKQQLENLPRKIIATKSLENGAIVIVDSIEQAIELANLYAPEHLCLMIEKAPRYTDQIYNAGCIFIGERATVVLGDYIAGPSHVLPTGGTARFSSPLNINDFMKLTNLVTIDEAILKQLGQAVGAIARAEGLEAHARAIEIRLGKDWKGGRFGRNRKIHTL